MLHLFVKDGVVESKIMPSKQPIKPFLKWAGGKTQLLSALVKHIPQNYGTYIEPFIGGGALFFHLRPEKAIISDSNPELINTYSIVKNEVEPLISLLSTYPHDKVFYYQLRAQNTETLSPLERAVRFIYLNRTCYNGLYRVNKKGQFNVPFGSYKNPTICDAPQLRLASQALQNVQIECGDYRDVLDEYALSGDFVFLDPPYYPVSTYSDFKRYTKEFFYEDDHAKLAGEFKKLSDRGVLCILTNSNTDFTRRLYTGFQYEIVNTKRNISCNGDSRENGQDLIVFATTPPKRTKKIQNGNGSQTFNILEKFPGTRFMGSKYSVLDFIWETIEALKFESVLDAFAGSGCVSYLFKTKGKRVYSNDLLHFSYHTANALIGNNTVTLTDDDIELLLSRNTKAPTFIRDTFKGIFFPDEENRFLDETRANIDLLSDSYKRSLALSALVRACLKKRPRGIFTYVGERYDDNRPDMRKSLREHFAIALLEYNRAVIDNHQDNHAFNCDVFDLPIEADLIYIDPPYYSPHSDSDYVRRYHFVEGLVRNWQGVQIQSHTKTKKFQKYATQFDGKDSTYAAFPKLFEKFRNSILVVSYSSNSFPSKDELADMLRQYKRNVSVYQVNHRYSFGTQHKNRSANEVAEYIFLGL
jgi:DNA adenine methylase